MAEAKAQAPSKATAARSPKANATSIGAHVIGVVGLGHMGTAFALNLIADGRRVLASDRDPARVEALVKAGAEPVSSPAGFSACDVALTSLPDDVALKAVTLDELIGNLKPGAVHLSMSTVSPGLSRFLGAEHRKHGQFYVAAPILGNPDLAKGRKLFVIAAGEEAAVDRVRPLLERLGQRLFVVGKDPGLANLLKLGGNVLTATTLQSMAEVLALLSKGGIDERVAFDVLTNSLFDSKVHRAYGGKIVDKRYRPAGMVVPLAVKDLRLALAEAERSAAPMPLASLVHDRLVALIAGGAAELDWSALGLLEARDAGLTASLEAPAPASPPA